MATLEKIRKKGKLLAIVIGFALAAFILGDLFSNKTGGGSANSIAEIDGNSISVIDFQSRMNAHIAFTKFATSRSSIDDRITKAIRQEVWEMIVKENILDVEYEEIGLDVSDKEISGLVLEEGGYRNQLLRSIPIFINPQTREFSPQMVNEFFNTYMEQSPEAKQFGLYLESMIRKDRRYSKYISLISKGINVTTAEAGMLYKERVEVVDFDYVVKKYATTPDSTITIVDKDLREYYDKHKKEYKQKYTRDIAYVNFEIIPSSTDSNSILSEINDYKKEFSEFKIDTSIQEIENFVKANSESSFNGLHLKKGDLGSEELDSIFFKGELGHVHGPYLDNGFYKLARVIEKIQLPDTVEARHILIYPDKQKIISLERAKEVADSILALIQGGADFAELAEKHSADSNTAKKGGKLDKFTEEGMQSIKKFSDACFYGKTGELKIVESQFGYHITEITYQSEKFDKIKLAVLDKKVLPGKETIGKIYYESSQFAALNNTLAKFEAGIENNPKLDKRIVTEISPEMEVIAGVDEPNQIISWTFKDEVEKGNISSKVFRSADNFIIAAVTEVREEGIAPLEQKIDEITIKVRKEKKGELFKKEFDAVSTNDLPKIAESVNGEIGDAKRISFSSSIIPGVGNANIAITVAVNSEKDEISKAIVGDNGVYVLKITSKTGVTEITDEISKNDKVQAENKLKQRVNFVNPYTGQQISEVYEVLKKSANIEDNRFKFF